MSGCGSGLPNVQQSYDPDSPSSAEAAAVFPADAELTPLSC